MIKKKIFGIGLNKTGTTSLGNYFREVGYRLYENIIKAKINILTVVKI